jgi:ribosomal protein S18 acetylase RimI-like enzyme
MASEWGVSMNTEELTFDDNGLTAEILSEFRSVAGWSTRPLYQYEKAIENSLFSVTAQLDGKVIATGRLIGDGVTDWYVKDIIVLPEFQRRGIGSRLMHYLLAYIKQNSLPGTQVKVVLMSAKGKEPFYEQLGFRVRPNERDGAGMKLNMQIEEAVE